MFVLYGNYLCLYRFDDNIQGSVNIVFLVVDFCHLKWCPGIVVEHSDLAVPGSGEDNQIIRIER